MHEDTDSARLAIVEYPFSAKAFLKDTPPVDRWPKRFASAKTLVLRDPDGRVMVKNTFPDTWNHLMLPFVSRDTTRKTGSVAELHMVLASLANELESEASGQLHAQASQLGFRMAGDGLPLGEPEHVVRYSLRLQAWTAYRFDYLLFDVPKANVDGLQATFAEPTAKNIGDAETYSAPARESFRRLAAGPRV